MQEHDLDRRFRLIQPAPHRRSRYGDAYGRWARDGVWRAFHANREPAALAATVLEHLRWCSGHNGSRIHFTYMIYRGMHHIGGRDTHGDGIDVSVFPDGVVRVAPQESWHDMPLLVEEFRWYPADDEGSVQYRAEPWSRHDGWLPYAPAT